MELAAPSGELTQYTITKPAFSTDIGNMELLSADYDIANPIIYDDRDDVSTAYAANLKKRFPDACKQIVDRDTDLSKLFNHNEIYVIGVEVLKAAVSVIADGNRMRKVAVEKFAQDFYKHHKFRTHKFLAGGRASIFSDEEMTEYGEEFLAEVLDHLKETIKPVIPLSLCESWPFTLLT